MNRDSAEQPTYAELLREQFSGNGRFEKAFTTNETSEYEEDKADLILRLFESYGVEMNEAQRKHIRRELLTVLTQITDDLY